MIRSDPSITVSKAGMLDTIQDLGRWGYSHWGINPGGVMDAFAASAANWLTGNHENTAVLELHFPAAQLFFSQDVLISVGGADFSPLLNEEAIPLWQPVMVKKHSLLTFRALRWGARCYLAVQGGFKLPMWLGSASTNLTAAAGGYHGRKLLKGDQISINTQMPTCSPSIPLDSSYVRLPWKVNAQEMYRQTGTIRFIAGPEWDWLDEHAKRVFSEASFSVSHLANRMGYTLEGPAIQANTDRQLISTGVTFGTMQLLPNGRVIVLMADHQTTGGYPRVGFVVSADLPTLAQCGTGAVVQFNQITWEAAATLARSQLNEQAVLKKTCVDNLNHYYAKHGHQL